MEDAEYVIVLIGSAAGTCKAAVDRVRERDGKKVGLLKIRVFRPFPEEELAQALRDRKAVAVLDRSEMFSATGGPALRREVSGGGRELFLRPGRQGHHRGRL